MNLINLGLIEKKFSQISKTSIVKLNSTATKSAVMCLFFEKNKKTGEKYSDWYLIDKLVKVQKE